MGPLCRRINAILKNPAMFVQQITAAGASPLLAPRGDGDGVRVPSMPPILLPRYRGRQSPATATPSLADPNEQQQ